MANDNQIQMEFLINDKSVKTQFAKIEKQAGDTSNKINDAITSGGSFINMASGIKNLGGAVASLINPYTAAAAAIGYASKQLFDFAIAGEQANAINIQFRNLAKSAGIAADEFADSIIKATEGLIDDEDALQIATKGIVSLGENAKKLPQILEISRAASRALGKDFKSTFEDLSMFVQTGNAKILKQYGIILDLDKAYTAAAKSIGLTSSQLSEQQKQTVRINLALEEMPSKFSAAAQSVTPLKDAFDRLKVSIGNTVEDLSTAFAEGFARTFIDAADGSNVATARLARQFNEAKIVANELNEKLKQLSTESLGAKGINVQAAYAASISQTRVQLAAAAKAVDSLSAAMASSTKKDLLAKLDQANKPKTADQLKRDADQDKLVSDAKKVREDSLTKFLNDQEIMRLQQKGTLFAQFEVLEMQHEQNLLNIRTQFSIEKGFTEDQIKAATLASDESYNAQREKINQDFLNTIQNQENESAEKVKQINEALRQGLIQSISNGMAKIGENLAKGAGAFDNFSNTILGILGDTAIQIGTILIGMGIGLEQLKIALATWNGAALIAAGVGLVVLGGALKGLAGGSGSSSGSAAAGGAPGYSGGIGATPVQESEIQQRGASVNVNISGDVFDTEETGLRIVDIISKSFDQNGVTVRGMA